MASPRETVDGFHELYYGAAGQTWQDTHWMGFPAFKCPMDMWSYQEILWDTRPDLIVECGTASGGSAQFFASMFDLSGTGGEILTIDIAGGDQIPGRPTHPRITYLTGSSTDPDIVEPVRLRAASADRVMVVLDSDHSYEHVAAEIAAYSPLVTPGCYLVVEDTNVNGNPVLPEWGPGPMEAVDEFLDDTQLFVRDPAREKFMMTFNPGGYLRRV
jgi:cephalosporin hydroxylase